MYSYIVPISLMVICSGPIWVSPEKSLRLCSAVVFFESGEVCGVAVLAFRLIALKDGGACATLERLRGSGSKVAVSRVVEEEGDKGSESREALFNILEVSGI